MIYVFACWRPSENVRRDSPQIFYIPCDRQEVAEKLAGIIERFGTDKGNIIELANINDLREYVSHHYRLTRFELAGFPISTGKLLELAQ